MDAAGCEGRARLVHQNVEEADTPRSMPEHARRSACVTSERARRDEDAIADISPSTREILMLEKFKALLAKAEDECKSEDECARWLSREMGVAEEQVFEYAAKVACLERAQELIHLLAKLPKSSAFFSVNEAISWLSVKMNAGRAEVLQWATQAAAGLDLANIRQMRALLKKKRMRQQNVPKERCVEWVSQQMNVSVARVQECATQAAAYEAILHALVPCPIGQLSDVKTVVTDFM